MNLKLPEDKHRAAILRAFNERLTIFDGSVRAGKTIDSLWAWCKRVKDGPPGNRMMIGKTERTLKRNVLDPLSEMAGHNFRLVSGSGECYLFGKRIYLSGASDERAHSKIQGVSLHDAYGDEISTWPESFFTMLLSRLSDEDAAFIGTTNPDSPMHWLKASYLDRAEELSLDRTTFRLEDNPHLTTQYIENIKREYTGLWYKRYIEGLWVVAEGAIYDMFDPDIHCVDEMPKLLRTWVGVDYGTTNATVFLPLSLGQDGVFYFHHEYRWDSKEKGRSKTQADYSLAFRQHMQMPPHEPGCGDKKAHNGRCGVEQVRWEWVHVDKSEPGFILQLKREGVRGAVGADNAVLPGIRDVSTLLGAGLLKFHRPTTLKTVEEMVSYAWDPKAQAQGEDKPLKVADHGVDAGRYAVRGARNVWRRLLPVGLVERDAA